MHTSVRWLLVLLVVIVTFSCFSGRKRGTGTNVGAGSDHKGPWSEGNTAALHEN